MRAVAEGSLVDRYYLVNREIARGGMGTVFEATHVVTKRRVALKVCNPDGCHGELPHVRLFEEARLMTSVRCSSIVEVLTAGECAEYGGYVILELLHGRTLAGILAARPQLSVADTVLLGLQVCGSLEFAHRRGVVHRDLKPSNLFVTVDERGLEVIKLFDFGVASEDPDKLFGTPEYLCPEVLLGGPDLGPRLDLYALGVTLFECLAGEPPWSGGPRDILPMLKNKGPRRSLRALRPDLSDALASVLERACAFLPVERFASAAALAKALVDATGTSDGHSTLLGGPREEPASEHPVRTSTTDEGTLSISLELDAELPPPLPSQRRQHLRVPYVTVLQVLGRDGATLLGRTEDISEGGVLVVAALGAHPTGTVEVRFALPVTGEVCVAEAHVRWVRSRRHHSAVGLEFVALAADARKAIAQHIVALWPLL